MTAINRNSYSLEQRHDHDSDKLSRLQEKKKLENTQWGMTMVRIQINANRKHGNYFTKRHHRTRLVPW